MGHPPNSPPVHRERQTALLRELWESQVGYLLVVRETLLRELSMAVVITIVISTACLLLLQAIHILKSGDTHPFFFPPKGQNHAGKLSSATKIGGILIYGVPACAILSLLVFAALKNGTQKILIWFTADSGNIIGGFILFIGGLLAILWPGWILKGVQAANPDTDIRLETAFGTRLTRLLGALLLGFGLFLLHLANSNH